MAKRSKVFKEVSSVDAGSVPSFDEQALSALTAKIEKGLGKEKASLTATAEPQSGQKHAAKANSKKTKHANGDSRGVKRDAKGNVKPPGSHKQKGQDDGAILLQEILALGGTEDDLDLVAGASSGDEDVEAGAQGSAAPDAALRKDLAKFVAGLGIEAEPMMEADEPDISTEDEDGEDGQEWEELSGEESSEEPSVPALSTTSKEAKSQVQEAKISDTSLSKDSKHLIFQARPDWHSAELPELPKPESKNNIRFQEAIVNLKAYAISLLEADSNLYSSKHLSSSSSHRFLSTIMSSGTLSDKVSALTLVVQESPVHTTKSFESLLALSKKRSRGQAVTALGALKDLLAVGVVLPADRRLRAFEQQPGLLGTFQELATSNWINGNQLPGEITKQHLISWAYEDWLKESYFEMLKILEGWCNDEVEYARSRAVTYVYELLKEKPEQESNLLRLLVNKLGDPDKKIASRTSYLLLQLQISHPLMKPIIVRSIESELLLRPGQSSHAKYYAINTLNQTILSGKEEEVASKLLDIYFDLFVTLLKKPEPKPVTPGPMINRKGQIQGGGGTMGKKAKAKATKEEEAKQSSEETTEKMISAVLTGVNRAFPFSKKDDLTLEKHMDTLFKITHSSNFNTSIQALMLIEQLATSKHLAVDRFYRTLYESLLDPRLITSSKHAMYLNLMFRALRSDLSIKRVKAFAKRLFQIITLHQPPFVCGVLYLVRELEETFPGLKSLFDDPEINAEEEEEIFRDVPEDPLEKVPSAKEFEEDNGAKNTEAQSYDGRKRDPEHSNADKTCLWELIPFLAHFHPSVSLFATRLIAGEKMPPKPDLASHTLTHFLDRFVYKNAKASAGASRGSSIMQPLSGGDSRGVLISNRSATNAHEPVNSDAFWKKKAENVAADEVFFHQYFSQIGKGKQASKMKKAEKAAKGSDDEEDENEDEIWQALVDSRPEIEGSSDNDSDLEMMDLDDSDAIISDADEDEDEDDDEDEALDDLGDGSDQTGSEDAGGVSLFEDEDERDSEVDELFEKELQKAQSKELKGKPNETSREKKRRLKNLPTFASAEDYAEMLENNDGEDF